MSTALVLEEIPHMRRLFRTGLERAGLVVLESGTGDEALLAAQDSGHIAVLVSTLQPGDGARR